MKRPYHIVDREEKTAAAAIEQLAKANGQLLLPLVELITQARIAVDEVIGAVGRKTIETVLMLSATEVAGAYAGQTQRGHSLARVAGWPGDARGPPIEGAAAKTSAPERRRGESPGLRSSASQRRNGPFELRTANTRFLFRGFEGAGRLGELIHQGDLTASEIQAALLGSGTDPLRLTNALEQLFAHGLLNEDSPIEWQEGSCVGGCSNPAEGVQLSQSKPLRSFETRPAAWSRNAS